VAGSLLGGEGGEGLGRSSCPRQAPSRPRAPKGGQGGAAARPPALTGRSQAAEVVGVAAERGGLPAAPPAPGAVAEGLELVGLAEIGPAVETAEQDLGRQRRLGPPRLPPRHPEAAGLPGSPALHRLRQQLQLLVLQLLEEGARRRFEGAGAVFGTGRRAALPPQPPHQPGAARAEHGATAGSACGMGTKRHPPRRDGAAGVPGASSDAGRAALAFPTGNPARPPCPGLPPLTAAGPHEATALLLGVPASPRSRGDVTPKPTSPQNRPPAHSIPPAPGGRGQGSTRCPPPPSPRGEGALTHGGRRSGVRGAGAAHGAAFSGRPSPLWLRCAAAGTFSCAGTPCPPPDLPVWGAQ